MNDNDANGPADHKDSEEGVGRSNFKMGLKENLPDGSRVNGQF